MTPFIAIAFWLYFVGGVTVCICVVDNLGYSEALRYAIFWPILFLKWFVKALIRSVVKWKD